MSCQLILLRHGETDYNHDRRIQGQLDIPLTEHGREAAASAAVRLSQWCGGISPDAVVCSDLSRAVETASIILARAGFSCDAPVAYRELRESHLGEWQGLTYDDIDARWPGARERFVQDPTWAPEGGESRADVALRMRRCIEDIIAPDSILLVVSHGAALTALMCELVGIPLELSGAVATLDNCRWAHIVGVGFAPTRWRLAGWNLGADMMPGGAHSFGVRGGIYVGEDPL